MTSIPNQNRKTSHPSHLPRLPLQPTPASLLLSQDPRLTQRLQNRNGFFSTGCRELDSHVLLNGGLNGGGLGGGFEGSCVVGLSCEEEETIGLAIGLQVIARMVLLSSDESKAKAKAMIITTLSTTSLLPRLRLAVVSEARTLLQGNGNGQQQVDRGAIKACLERVLVARVFDAEGLREVLRELEGDEAGSSSEDQEKHPQHPQQQQQQQQQQRRRRRRQGNDMQEENEQSHDGGENSSSKESSKNGHLPDLILITNTSHLLNTLFTRNKTGADRWSTAHNSAVQLSDQIRALSRRGPLVMLLNSTTSPASSSNNNSTSIYYDDNRGPKQPDLSIMRSIFNPPLPAPMEAAPGYMAGLVGSGTATGPVASYRGGGYGSHRFDHQAQTQSAAAAAAAAAAASRRNKPSYGMVFSQMLDLHLLCTKVPRGRARHGGGYSGYGGYGGFGGYVWAVEVLLDELGVYEGLEGILGEVGGGEGEGEGEKREEGKGTERRGLIRRSREQRWGAVEIEEGSGRVVDAFR